MPGNGPHTQNSGTHLTLAQCWNVVTGESGIARKKAPCHSERERTRARARFEHARQNSSYIKTPCKLRHNGLNILKICSHPGLCCATGHRDRETICRAAVHRQRSKAEFEQSSQQAKNPWQHIKGFQVHKPSEHTL